MSNPAPAEPPPPPQPQQPSQDSNRSLQLVINVFLLVMVLLLVAGLLIYVIWRHPSLATPIATAVAVIGVILTPLIAILKR
ncbi:hypothetical protein OG436_39145 (plasmid) [Streptomyces caniferus]|uniref:hypothetical protein n=1 Tax=Streptomyces caniferus TaxID=285557 RepID=UPI002E27B6B6|nr:hypothetical protein [Streptomyces caniferus]